MKYYLVPFIITLFLCGCSISDSQDEGDIFPSIATTEVLNVTQNSVSVGGAFIEDGQSRIIDKGVVWGLINTPTLDGIEQSVGSGTEDFSATISGLESNTAYMVRAYAKTGQVVVYGNIVEFTTLE